ncbi:MAG: PTPDL family protein, partial [Verrucomicrobiota bacterium]
MIQQILKASLITLLIASLSAGSGLADEIQMKSGETYSGRITYEGDDIVKIEIQISSSIKETKILSRSEIAQIAKEAPDDVEFAKIEMLLPTDSLITAASYRSMIETGPTQFLKRFPESKHVAKVTEIKTTLEEELDKVERGFIKLEENWISPQEREQFKTKIDSTIRFLRMEKSAAARNYNGFIGAMREYEVLEKDFHGTPAFARGVELAQQIVPTLGSQVSGMLRDLEVRNAEYERNKAALNEADRMQVEAARKREEEQYQAGVAADKKRGIKWVRLNRNSQSSLESYLSLLKGENTAVGNYDTEALKAKAQKLTEVDELIAKGNLEVAQLKLNEANDMSVVKPGAKSSKSKKGKSYGAILGNKIDAAEEELEAKAKALEEAKESQSLVKNLS